MAKNLVLENVAANASCDAECALANGGYLRIKTSGDVLLAELRFGSPAFGSAVAGVATANAVTPEDSAPATGVAAKYEVYKSDGTTKLWTGTVGTADSNLVLNSVNIQSGAQVSVTSLTHTVPKQAA